MPEDEDTSMNDCVAVLDNYFTPKLKVPFERHESQQMQQIEQKTMCQRTVSYFLAWIEQSKIRSWRNVEILNFVRHFSGKSSEATLTVLEEKAVNTQMQSMERPVHWEQAVSE